MGEEKDPKDAGKDTGKDKTKVNIGPDGEPLKPGDEGYLYAEKYKTIEEMEKGVKEAEQKITELGQGKSLSDKALKEFRELIVKRETETKAGKETDEEIKEKERRGKLALELKEAWETDPVKALEFLEKRIKEGQTGVMTKGDYEAKLERDRVQNVEYNRVRGTGDPSKGIKPDEERIKEFDALKPVMSEIWDKLPDKAKVPEMMETVFFAAKAKASPELKDKLIKDLKAGTTQKGGVSPAGEKKTEDEKTIDGIIDQAEKDKQAL